MIRSRTLAGVALAVALMPIPMTATLAAEPTITLRVATAEDPDRPSQPFLDTFKAEVERASGGSMQVEASTAPVATSTTRSRSRLSA